jgi:hypothetical protein
MVALTENYFQKFPLINYTNVASRNIFARVKILEAIKQSEVALLPYSVQDGDRADTIANAYYGSPNYAWAIYLVNEIIDPLHEWPKSEYDLNNFIQKKYGSLEDAREEILYYRVNWATDQSILSVEQFEGLPYENQKYWQPQTGFNSKILNYVRKDLDWTIDTFRLDLVKVESANTSNVAYQVGERVYQYSNTNTLSLKGTVAAVHNTTTNSTATVSYITLKQTVYSNTQLSQYITANGNYLIGKTSTSNCTIKTAERVDKTETFNTYAIYPEDSELVYWEMVDAEMYEREENERKKEIKVLDKTFILSLEENLAKLLRPNE